MNLNTKKYSPKQKKLAAVAPPRKKITAADFKKLQSKKKTELFITPYSPNLLEYIEIRTSLDFDLKPF